VIHTSPRESPVNQFSSILGLDRLPSERTDHLHPHFRAARRSACYIRCDLQIVLADGSIFDTGSAILCNLSPTGALLTCMHLEGAVLPLARFTLSLKLRGNNYDGIRIDATPMRYGDDGFTIGVRFDDMAVELS
jgi:hypothetical protein